MFFHLKRIHDHLLVSEIPGIRTRINAAPKSREGGSGSGTDHRVGAAVRSSLLRGYRRGGGEGGSTDSGHDTSDPRELGRAGGEFRDKSADETANERGDDDIDRNEPPGQNGSSNEFTANIFLNLKNRKLLR